MISFRQKRHIVSIQVDAVNPSSATKLILELANSSSGSYVCVANVHMTMEAYDNPKFAEVVNSADLVVPDGMPLVWMLTALRATGHRRVRGPDLTLDVARKAALLGIPVAAYGGTERALNGFVNNLRSVAPELDIRAAISPPFKTLTEQEENEFASLLRASGARIIFVGLGCPKQEWWMARNSAKIGATMLGVGAAFDFHAGLVREAPSWMQSMGLEWLFRLTQDPKRLWQRYLKHNPRFIGLALLQLIGGTGATQE